MKLLKWLGIAVAVLVVVCVIGAVTVYAMSNRALARTYDVAPASVPIPADSAALARGRHIVDAIAKCKDCHGENLGGTMFLDIPPFARVAAPNLTRGRGGVGGQLQDADWVRAIRHGVMPGGRGAIIMPAEAYRYLSDSDLGAVIAYVKSVPAVDSAWPAPQVGPIGRTLLAMGKLPIFPAAYIDHSRASLTFPPADSTPAYGQYLANVGGCTSCHNPELTGGKLAGSPPDAPAPANLTPIGLAGWTEADFFRVFREGKRPDGRQLDNRYMPWRSATGMTDLEVRALWRFLQTVPPKEMPAQ